MNRNMAISTLFSEKARQRNSSRINTEDENWRIPVEA
jgi:hypothetical protein